MPTASVYEISVSLHVAAVMIALGPTFIFPIIQLTAEKAFPRQLPFAWRVIQRIDKAVVIPGTTLIGLTGVYQWIDGGWDITKSDQRWLAVGAGLFLFMYVVGTVVFHIAEPRAIATSEAMVKKAGARGRVALSDEYRQVTKLANIVGPLLGVLVLVVVYLMVAKPF
jgi:uncharacterized membrane protein